MSIIRATEGMLKAVNDIVEKARRLHDGIPEVTVVLGASGATRSGQKHGHYASRSWGTRGPVSEDADGGDAGSSTPRAVYGEILLAGESLGRGAVATLGTILHELVHAYCDANDIKDTSNGNRYHNAKFRDTAEEFGLSIDKADVIGWSVTTVPEGTQGTYAQEIQALERAISVYRLGYTELSQLGLAESEKAKPKVRRMQCPECQEPLTVTKKWWALQGNGGDDYEYGAGLICREHEMEYEIYEEGGE